MAGKLIFYYGTVCSSKTLNLLAIAHNYEKVGWNVCTVKPSLDTRSELIETRAQVPPRKASIIIGSEESFNKYYQTINEADVIVVDECQFLSPEQIDELRSISTSREIDVLCFGLRTDFTVHLFPASKRLFELADELNEIKTICSVCGKHAGFNTRIQPDSNTLENNIEPSWYGFEQRCWKHYIAR